MTKSLTRSGLTAALSLALLFAACALPSAKISLIAVSGVLLSFLRISCGLRWAAGCFAAVTLLAAFVLPQKLMGILYALFFGYYPFVKPTLERAKSPVLRWMLKLLIFWAALSAACFLASAVMTAEPLTSALIIPMFLGGTIVFVIYDFALTRLILYYLRHLAGKL